MESDYQLWSNSRTSRSDNSIKTTAKGKIIPANNLRDRQTTFTTEINCEVKFRVVTGGKNFLIYYRALDTVLGVCGIR